MTFPFDMTQASPMNIFSSINRVTSLDALLWPSPSPMHYHCCHFSFLILFFLVHSRLTTHFLPVETCTRFFLCPFRFPSFSGVSMVVIYFPIPPNQPTAAPTFLFCHALLLLCSARPTRTAIFCISYTHTYAQTSPLHSRLRALSCMFARSSKFHPNFFFLFLFSVFSLSLSSPFAPESFPFDPVQNPWLYVLVQKATK